MNNHSTHTHTHADASGSVLACPSVHHLAVTNGVINWRAPLLRTALLEMAPFSPPLEHIDQAWNKLSVLLDFLHRGVYRVDENLVSCTFYDFNSIMMFIDISRVIEYIRISDDETE